MTEVQTCALPISSTASPRRRSSPSLSLPTVLLVEDNQMLLDVLLMVLPRMAPFQFVGVSDGDTGLEQCYALRPACIVIDIIMPGLNGYQLVRALRGDPRSEEHTPELQS